MYKIVLGMAAVFGLAACPGKEEANAMGKFREQMCACKTVECVDKLFPEIEKFTIANQGKQVEASAADRYEAELDATQKCYDAFHKE